MHDKKSIKNAKTLTCNRLLFFYLHVKMYVIFCLTSVLYWVKPYVQTLITLQFAYKIQLTLDIIH